MQDGAYTHDLPFLTGQIVFHRLPPLGSGGYGSHRRQTVDALVKVLHRLAVVKLRFLGLRALAARERGWRSMLCCLV